MTIGRVFHTGQAIVDIVMRIPALPPRGGDLFTSQSEITAGGGFNLMAAAARDGAEVHYLGVVGDGPFAEIVTAALRRERIKLVNAPIIGQDTGFCVALVDADAERTFVSTLGAEGEMQPAHLRGASPARADVICVSGYSLAHAKNRAVLLRWLPEQVATIVFDPSPLIGELDAAALNSLAALASIWTLNARESALAAQRFGGPVADRVAGTVLIRDGAAGTRIAGREPIVVPAYPVAAVDTNGAGDAHTGVLAAALARGEALEPAVRRANVAAALAVTRHGPATAPTTAAIDAALARGPA